MSSPEFKINVNLETTRQLLPPREEKQQKFENAQAYKKARDCLYLGTKIGNQISKQFREAISKDYSTALYNQCLYIALAYNEADKNEKLIYLNQAIKSNTKALIILRLAYDLNGVNRSDYTASITLIVELGMQLKMWKSSLVLPPTDNPFTTVASK